MWRARAWSRMAVRILIRFRRSRGLSASQSGIDELTQFRVTGPTVVVGRPSIGSSAFPGAASAPAKAAMPEAKSGSDFW